MAKLGTDSYLAKFDKYGGAKIKKNKESKKKDKSDGKGGSKKKDKSLKKLSKMVSGCMESVNRLQEDLKTVAEAENDLSETVYNDSLYLGNLKEDMDKLKKAQKEMEAKIRLLEKTQRSLKKEMEVVSAEPTE